MRSIWKGSIGFGLVNIPVRLYAAVEEKDVKFNSLHAVCGAQIRYLKYCPVCDREVGQDEIARGFQYDKGRFVVIGDEDLERLPAGSSRQVEIVDFVDLPDIDPIYYDKSYYLEPDTGAEKPYALLRRAMEESNKVAVAKVSLRHKESLACVRVYRGALVMETMHYPDEIRAPERLAGVDDKIELGERELDMAKKLVENLSGPFDPERYEDGYRKELLDLIRRKIEGQPETERVAVPAAGKVVDLMEALEASLRATRPKGRRKAEAAGRAQVNGKAETAGKALAKAGRTTGAP